MVLRGVRKGCITFPIKEVNQLRSAIDSIFLFFDPIVNRDTRLSITKIFLYFVTAKI